MGGGNGVVVFFMVMGGHNIILDNIFLFLIYFHILHYSKEFHQSVTMTPYEGLVMRASRPVTKGGAAAVTAVLAGWVAIAFLIKMAVFG